MSIDGGETNVKTEIKADQRRLAPILLWSLLSIMAIFNLLLVRQNYEMRSQLEARRPVTLKQGDVVKQFSGRSMQGNIVDFKYTGTESTRVMLYFTVTCPFCREQFPYWKQMFDDIDRNKYQVIGVVSESEDINKLHEYLSKFGCESLPIIAVSRDVAKEYRLFQTPTTLVIDNQGKVQQAWIGKWQSAELITATSLFRVQFQNQ